MTPSGLHSLRGSVGPRAGRLLLAFVLAAACLGVVELTAREAPPDFESSFAPLVAQARQTLARGEWPLWYPRAGAGYPLLATADAQVLHPFTAILYPLPPGWWLAVLVAARVAVGLAGAYLFLRLASPRAGRGAALAGAGIFAASVATFAAQPLATVAALLPVVLWSVARWERDPGPVGRLGVVAASTALLLSGQPAAGAVVLAVALVHLAVRLLPSSPAVRRRRLLELLGLLATAVLLSGAVLLPALIWRPQSQGAVAFAELRDRDMLPGLAAPHGGEGSWLPLLAALALVAGLAFLARRSSGDPARRPADLLFTGIGGTAVLALLRAPVVPSLLEYLFVPTRPWYEAPLLPLLGLALAWLTAAAVHAPPAGGGDRPGLGRRAAAAAALAIAAALVVPAVARSGGPPAPDPELIAHLQRRQAERGYSRIAALGDLLPAELASRHGLSDARGVTARLPAPYVAAVQPLLEGAAGRSLRFAPLSHPLYDLLGVRWLLTAADPAARPGSLDARFGLQALWERGSAAPLVFLPPRVRAARSDDDWRAWLRFRPDLASHALAQHGVPGPTCSDAGAACTVELVDVQPGRIVAGTALSAPGLVATSIYQDGGWTVLADGRASPSILVNGPFVGAWLPASARRLDLLYRAPGLLAGSLLSALGLGALAALTLRPSAVPPSAR